MNGEGLSGFTVILASFTLSLALTAGTRKILLRRALLDHPNERSSHTAPVPRGGGWAILLVLFPGLVVAALGEDAIFRYGGLLAGLAILALISWLDDRKGVSPLIRLACHMVAAIFGSLSLTHHQVLFGGFLPFWLDRTIMIVGWAWFMNLYNFMDGIDGITGVETIVIATGACLVMSAGGFKDPFVGVLTLLLTGTCLGFLVFNWHPAKIFLGDIGSIPLGFLTGFALLRLAVEGFFGAALILPLYYLADSMLTLLQRMRRGEKIWQPHRQHFYQRAARGFGRHDRVVFYIIAADGILIVLAVLATTWLWLSLVSAVAVVAFLLARLHKVGATNATEN